jgi:hypothetical protein
MFLRGGIKVEFKGLKINIIVMVIGIVLLSYFIGQYLLKTYSIDKPLQEELLKIEEIEKIELVENDGKKDIIVFFKPGINLFQTYKKIAEISTERLGDRQGRIIIENETDRYLTDLYYKLHYALYEGLATHEFVNMEHNVREIIADYDLDDYKLWIDNEAVYLQLAEGNNSFYKRIPFGYLDTGGDLNG